MFKAITRGSAVLALTVVGLCGMGQKSHAQFDPGEWVRETVHRGIHSVETEAGRGKDSINRSAGIRYQLRIKNPSNGPIYYGFSGMPYAVSKQTITTWTGTCVGGHPRVTFENGNSQTVSYTLRSGAMYVFAWLNGVLNLYEDR